MDRRPRPHRYSALLLLIMMFAASRRAIAGEIQSLLQRGLPTSLDPASALDQARARAYPLQPVDRLPFYGLPYDLVDTTTGRLAFKINDLVLPGRMPIIMSRFLDSWGPIDLPAPLPDRLGRYGADLGPDWSFAYSDYIQPVPGGYVLAKAEGGPIKFVPESSGSSTYKKERDFPSNHLKLKIVNDTTIDESRADGTTWRFTRQDPDGYFILVRVTDRPGNFIALT